MRTKFKNNEIVNWWEGKRKAYNFILIGFSVFILVRDYRYHLRHEELLPPSIMMQIIFLIIWMIGANIFYCLGAGFETTCSNYKFDFTNKERWALFIFGILVSIIWTTFSFSSP